MTADQHIAMADRIRAVESEIRTLETAVGILHVPEVISVLNKTIEEHRATKSLIDMYPVVE